MPRTDHYSTHHFLTHLIRNLFLAILFIIFSLIIGVVGYHHFAHLEWIDAFENAAMILSGMGPVTLINTPSGKVFAGCYALFSGLMFILLIGIILSPIIHKVFTKIKLDK